ncbi:MAG: NAD(P)H-hydrate dehydratase [Actinobacteria bacterium]|nr:NAD(P)H-hydrate dehydratase [Actinomycetota bacterium]
MRTVPEGALMRRAAAGLAARCAGLLGGTYGRRVVLLVGAGNNGGDALYAGARLAARGAGVDALLLQPDRAHPGGVAAFRSAGGRLRPVDARALAGADLVLDGIVGISGRGTLHGEAATLAAAAVDCAALRVAVDVPSGVAADTGAVEGAAFAADLTVTFGCLKPGLVLAAGRTHAGVVDVVDIGLAPHLPPARISVPDIDDVAGWLPRPAAEDDKYSRGVVGVASGSAEYGGAAVLSVGGAVRGFAGMVRYAGSAAAAVRARWPEVVVSESSPAEAGRVQAWVVGPGLGTDEQAERVVREVLASDVPVLVDADGLTVLARHPEWVRDRRPETLLTPHDREFARLAGEVGDDRIAAARRASAQLGATVLLKGDATVIAGPDGAVRVDLAGTPWLATAGSGDVLSGLAGSLLASGRPALEAAAAATFLHGLAGRLGNAGGPISATTLLSALPDATRTTLTERR